MRKMTIGFTTFFMLLISFVFFSESDLEASETSKLSNDEEAPTITNPGFETGDLTGWTKEGTAFDEPITDTEEFWGGPFGHEGTYHLWGFSGADEESNADARTGILESETFTLGGNGQIDFLIGGGQDSDRLYVSLVRSSDNKELFKATGADSEKYRRVRWDASDFISEKVYIKIVDQHTGGFGHINVDDFRVYNTDDHSEEEKGVQHYWAFDEQKGKFAYDEASDQEDLVEYVFNDAKYKTSTDPLWKQGIKEGALLYDGYSTWVTRPAEEAMKPKNELTIEAWVAPRSYEWGDLGQMSAIVNQVDKKTQEGYILGMGRHGKWSLQAGMDGDWYEVWADEDKPLKKDQWSYIAATIDQEKNQMELFLNGESVGVQKIPENTYITPSNNPLMIGKHNQAASVTAFKANMFNGLMDEVKIHNESLTEEEVKGNYDKVVSTYQDQKLPDPNLDLDRSVYDGDRHRPQYHMMAPGHWMNEPHAPLKYNGKYHIFYQHNPQGPYWHQIHWGHMVSDDMVHWEDAPVALAPSGVSPDGVWSGDSTIGPDGNPALLFTAGDDSKTPNQMTGLATAADPSDPMLKEWEMYDEPVTVQENGLAAEEGEIMFGQFRDPYVWKDGETYYQLVGSGIEDVGGTALLYTSKDLKNWDYEGPFFSGNTSEYPKTGDVWELPVMLPVGEDSNGDQKYAFFINPWFSEYSEHNVKYVFHWIGTWDKETNKFVPDHEEPRLFDYGEHLTGPSGMVDESGKSTLFTISQDRRSEQQHYDAGWAHNAGLPLSLSLQDNNELGIEPIKEIDSLRGEQLASFKNKSIPKANEILENVEGDTLEIELEIKADTADEYGIQVRRTADGEEQVGVYYDENLQQFGVDATKMSLNPDIQKTSNSGELELDGENLKLSLYVDRSMIEAYANGKKSITTRAYPTRSDALGIKLWSKQGKAKIESMKIWEMDSAYGEEAPAYHEPKEEEIPHEELTNHDFQTGDLTGWKVIEGNTFSDEHVTNADNWGWGGPFSQATTSLDPEGYHLWGYNPEIGDAGTGVLQSETFTLGGNGQIDFLTSGGDDKDKLYVALINASTGEILKKATGQNDEAYRRLEWDASEYIGEKLYIQLVDQSTGGFGHINLDDVNVPVQVSSSSKALAENDVVTMQKESNQKASIAINLDEAAKEHPNNKVKKSTIKKHVKDIFNHDSVNKYINDTKKDLALTVQFEQSQEVKHKEKLRAWVINELIKQSQHVMNESAEVTIEVDDLMIATSQPNYQKKLQSAFENLDKVTIHFQNE
ncbi:GH32 C-terminal domain-containing protein [Halobacillus campisalis]|uniref:beta-fructofuranosidase n=1 Tax=Halobacillus campisalis TaxID=435909 RepID=A0ABW2K6I4_9BACI|nr:GH32 C-terminal domain-containing protein [Halobacillus campisalis]